MKLLITGGHHSSAIPLIQKIRAEQKDIELFWVGHRHSLAGDINDTLEYKEITSMGIKFYDLRTAKVYKKYNPLLIFKLINGFISSYKILSTIKPDLIMSFGGYLAVPVVITGWAMRIPSLTHEQTVTVGYANKVISFFARKILISWPDTQNEFPKTKTQVTGLPLRSSIFTIKSSVFDAQNNFPYVFVLGGKTGSVKINEAVGNCLLDLLKITNVIHQCGDYSQINSFSKLSDIYGNIKDQVQGKYYLRKFILEDEIGEAFARANLVVTRAGAHIMGEILALNKPALFIPIPWVSHNEQQKNADLVKKCGLGEILEEKDLSAINLLAKISYQLKNLSSYKNNMAINYKELSATAVPSILAEILKYAPSKA